MTLDSRSNMSEIDRSLYEWASEHGLAVTVLDHWDAVAKRVTVVDSEGDVYEIYAGRAKSEPDNSSKQVQEDQAVAGAGLVKRRSSKHLAFHRERTKFHFERRASVSELHTALNEALAAIQEWVARAGHTMAPADKAGILKAGRDA